MMARPEGHKDPEYLVDVIHKSEITILHFVPSMLQQFLAARDVQTCASLRYVICSGEALPWETMRRCLQVLPAELHNLYGPTEAAIDVSHWPCTDEGSNEIVPIGRPVANTQLYILDTELNPLPVGIAGELHIGGIQLARGYLNRPELTAEKFIPNPFREGRLYKTGDLARYLPDGNIAFLGRMDSQVKIRGFRIELGEIETVLSHHPAIRDALVLVREDSPGNPRLTGYVIAKAGETVDIKQWSVYLKQKLPEYMVPNAWVVLDAWPLTPNGKVDRKALPAPEGSRDTLENAYIAPRTPEEEKLAAIWQKLLGVEQVGIHDNFFDLGGHSLLATQLMARIRNKFNAEVPLQALFTEPTIAELTTFIAEAKDKEAISLPPLTSVQRPQNIPLSFAQQRLWFLSRLEADTKTYHVALALRLEGTLNRTALEQSLNALVARHESLRTCFPEEQGRPQQAILESFPLPLLVEEATEEVLPDKLAEYYDQTFDLAQAPLHRFKLFALAEKHHVFLWILHHSITDGWSMTILRRELKQCYEAFATGRPSPLQALSVQYADYTLWQRSWLKDELFEAQLAYWQKQLAGVPSLLELPSDHVRPSVMSYRGASQVHHLDTGLLDSLQTLSRRNGCTLFMTLLSAFEVLLYRYSNQEDFCIGSPTAHRLDSKVEDIVGFFINTLVLRSEVEPQIRFADLLKRVQSSCLAAYEHQSIPFENLIDHLDVERSLSYNPLFQVMFTLQNTGVEKTREQWLDIRVSKEPRTEYTAKFDLSLDISETEEGLACIWEYAVDLFDAVTIERMAGYFEVLLRGIVEKPRSTIESLPLLSEPERHQLLVEWNDTARDYPRDKCIHELFEEQAKKAPDAIAAVYEEDSMTYGQLNKRANQLAHYLIERGVKPDTLVGICMERSLAMLVGLLGILKAGGAYVPLDPSYPQERLEFMLEDAAIPVIVTQQQVKHDLGLANKVNEVICLDSDQNKIADASEHNLPPLSKPRHLAYVIYTSGSTGKPKGVMIEHQSLTNFLYAMKEVTALNSCDKILAVTTLSFDIAALELYLPLIVGACIYLVSRETAANPELLAGKLCESKATLMQATPATWQMLFAGGWSPCREDFSILCGGEAMTQDLAQGLLSCTQQVCNVYGPTETTIWSSSHAVDTGDIERAQGAISIGRPIANTQLYILDRHFEPTPIGVVGELYIGGDGLARGYLNRPELTAEKFIANPFGEGRLYRTGDLARYLPDGSIEFLGRIDHQVKIRGFRIELGEIEAALNEHPMVREAIVLAREDQPDNPRLVAYVISQKSAELDFSQLRTYLKESLPEYMVPGIWVALERFPLTPNGKIDRKILPAPEAERPKEGITQPRNSIELQLTGIWEKVLSVHPIGIDNNFFDLGGHSLLAVRMMAQIQENFGVSVPLAVLFQTPTIRALSQVLQTQENIQHSPLVPIRKSGSKPALFLIHPVGGSVWCYRTLAEHLGSDQTVYGLQAKGLYDKKLDETIPTMANRYREAIETVQPEGPYHLGGWSMGGVIAFEMARRWREKGQAIGLLTLMDSYPRLDRVGDEFSIKEFAEDILGLYFTKDSKEWDGFRTLNEEEQWQYLIELEQNHSGMNTETAEKTLQQLKWVYDANSKAALAYKPGDYDGEVLLFTASESTWDGPKDRDWGKISAKVEQHEIEGSHYDLMREPAVGGIEERIRKNYV